MKLATPETGAVFMTKNGKLISMWPDVASSRRVISSSICRNDSTDTSRSCWCSTSTKRDMCVPLKSWGRATYMLKLATVCCSRAVRSRMRTG
jgi:hypothetical protein